MAHEVEKMAYVGETPWHGLGKTLSPDTPFDDWFDHSGLNYDVLETPVHYQLPSSDGGTISVPFKGLKALYRSTDNRPLSVVSDRYRVVQPREVLEFYRTLVESYGFSIETAGVLREGRRIWALARTNEFFKVCGEDEIRPFIMLATSYDLSFSTTVQLQYIRTVCNNTLTAALNRNERGAVRIPHHASFDPEKVKEQLGITAERLHAFDATATALANMKLSVERADAVLKTTFRVPDEVVNDTQRANQNHSKRVLDMYANNDYIGHDYKAANGTAWGLINCVTEYVDFRRRARTQASRLDNAWFGEGPAIKQRAVQECLRPTEAVTA
jgi:phage/plasmid-like protein (TIGR03299 family)